MSNGLQFNPAGICGEHNLEATFWVSPVPEGFDHASIAETLKAAGFKAMQATPRILWLTAPSGAKVELKEGTDFVTVQVPLSLENEARESFVNDEADRLNAVLGLSQKIVAMVTAAGLTEDFKAMVEERIAIIQDLYRNENMPIVIGYSGGKDSTAVAQLCWEALRRLPAGERTKTIHLVSTDTGVENPVVARMGDASLEAMNEAARAQGLPWEAHRLRPTTEDSYWTMVLGRGYAVPRPLFRWCTERLKISPANAYVMEFVEKSGGVIQVLGTRKTESVARGRSMERHQIGRTRPFMSPNQSLNLVDGRKKKIEGEDQPKAWIFSPIEDWSTEDVWTYITQVENPWGYDNANISAMYASASDASECPMTLDASQSNAPSCGKSRFGCWTCTLVEKEKSLTSFIENDPATYGWLEPLLTLRNRLNPREEGQEDSWSDAPLRSHYRVQEQRFYLFYGFGKHIKGRYIQPYREEILRDLLRAQARIQAEGPDWVRSFELITVEELEAIRDLWLTLWNEVEDNLPVIYEEVLGVPYPGPARKPFSKTIRPLVEAMKSVAVDEAKALGEDGRLLFEQAREIVVMEALRAKSETARDNSLSIDEIYHRHQVHSLHEADGLARREQSRRESIKRVITLAEAQVRGKEVTLKLSLYRVSLPVFGDLEICMNSEVVATTPAAAVEAAAASWVALHDDHERLGASLEALLAGGQAFWIRQAGPKETATVPVVKERWWRVNFYDAFSVVAKAPTAIAAGELATQDARAHLDVLAALFFLTEDEVRAALDAGWTNATLAPGDKATDRWLQKATLAAKAKTIRRALGQKPALAPEPEPEVIEALDLTPVGQHPALFGAEQFLEDWFEEVG